MSAVARVTHRAVAGLAGAAVVLVGCFEPTVVRVVEGRAVAGRYISPQAYTYYAFGADAEARGDLEYALSAYEAAVLDDETSVEIWTRIGVVRCFLGRSDANDAFDEAEDQDPGFGPLWRDRARCATHRKDHAAALAFVDRAVALDPDDAPSRILRATSLGELGRPVEALHELRALTLEKPRSIGAWRARYALAVARRDETEIARAASALIDLVPRESPLDGSPATIGAFHHVDAALSAGDLATAHRLGRRAGLDLTGVVARAAALGHADLAAAQAEIILRADPTNTTARMVLASAADLTGDQRRFARALADLPPSRSLTPPSLLARALFAELLLRRVDRASARTFWATGESTDDPLTREIVERLNASLASDRSP